MHGEEAGGERADTEWLVDPLDGTANFVHGFDAVGVSIGLVHEGRPVVGVVHAPLLANRGRSSRSHVLGDRRRRRVPRRPRRSTSAGRAPEQAIVATGFPFRRKHLLPEFLAVLRAGVAAFEDLRRVGAASLDLCWVGEGVFDGFFELQLGPWDVAAGGARRARGRRDRHRLGRRPRRVAGERFIVAAPPAVHTALLELTAARELP